MGSAASHLSRNWGDYGYRIGLEHGVAGGGLFLCSASDGSEFRFYVDRYGNVVDIPESCKTSNDAWTFLVELREYRSAVNA